MIVMTASCLANFMRGKFVGDDIALNQWLDCHFGPKVNVIIVSLSDNENPKTYIIY